MAKTKTKPKPKTKPLNQRFTQQAKDEAFLRFNPERGTLRGALQTAGDQLQNEVQTARGTATSVRAAAKASQPVLRKVFSGAQGQVAQGQQDITAATGGSPLGPAAARDSGGAQRRLAETLANALSETEARQTEAASGASFAINNATDRYGRNVDKIQTRLGDLSQEEGKYVSGRVGALLGEQAKQDFTAQQNRANRSVTRRGQTLSHEDRQAAADARAAEKEAKRKANPTLPGGVKARTPGEQTRFKDAVATGLRTVKPFVGKVTRDKARALFLTGAPAQTVVDDKKLAELQAQNPNASITDLRRRATTKLPAVPKIPESQLRVVLDMLYDGHISPETARALHGAGIIVKPLGSTNRSAPRPGGVKRPPTAAERKRQQTARRVTGTIPGFGGQ